MPIKRLGWSVMVLLAFAGVAPAPARQGEAPVSLREPSLKLLAFPVLTLEAVDVEAELFDDERHAKDGIPDPVRYAVPADVLVSPATHGRWEDLADGDRLWRLAFHSPGATDLNFGFTRFRLPAGARLWAVGRDGSGYEGPYTYEDNEGHGELWTPPVAGEEVWIELFVPAAVKFEPELELTRVGRGFRDMTGRRPAGNRGPASKQGACNNDVICPEGDPWRDEIRSVAAYSLNGALLCTGTMIRDVPSSFRPFFLTANHCGIDAGNAPSMVVFWNYESPVCGQLGGGSLADNQTGAIYRASAFNVDMALVELDDPPPDAYDVFWSGWDRSGAVPQGSVGIHHANTEEKVISFNDDPLTTTNSCVSPFGFNTHWRVDAWEDGTTEPGSSGSGLWDPATRKLVGFLTGGVASCTNLGYDCYGKLSVAWDGFTASSRLRDWLDPDGTGALSVDGGEPLPELVRQSHRGEDSCGGDGNGVWEPGETVQVSVSLRATGDFTGIEGTLSSASPGVSVLDASATWPDLAAGAVAESDAPHFTVRLDPTVACLSSIAFDLEVTAAEGGPFHLTLHQPIRDLVADAPRPIPDGGSTTSTLFVAENVTLGDLNVFVDIAHTYVGDLAVTLTSPAGTTVTLLDRPGFPALPFGCNNDDMTVTFDDEAAAPDLESHCPGTTPWHSGPAPAAEALAAFDGESTAGTWTLAVVDHVNDDRGDLVDWQLLTDPPIDVTCEVCSGSDLIFADGFESGDVSAWSGR